MFAELPIMTPPVDVPVFMFVTKLELLLILTGAPVSDAPKEPVSNPAEVMVPVPVADIFPLVVTLSPNVVGDRVMPVLLQYPRIPVVGGIEVSVLLPLVYTPALGVSPLTVNPVKVGLAPV